MINKQKLTRIAFSVCLFTGLATAYAQPQTPTEPRNIVQLSAKGVVEAQQDWLTLNLSVTKDGQDANAVQSGLRQALDAALKEVRKTAQVGDLEVRSGAFSLQPRYSNDGKITGWNGSSELILEGTDFARISSAAARAQTMAIRNIAFGLSRQARTQLESQAQSLAIDNFKARALQISRSFGFADYALREVNVNADEQSGGPVPRMMAMSSRAMVADAPPVPMEAGKSLVVVSVSGAVQLK